MNFNCLILAAGFGTRLGEFGLDTPKGLIKVGQTTILGRLLNMMASLKPQSYVLITNSLHYSIYQNWQERSFYSLKLVNNGVSKPHLRVGALADAVKVIEMHPCEDWLILPSDTLFDFSLSRFIKFAQTHRQGMSTIFREFTDNSVIASRLGCGVVLEDKLINFYEKPVHPPSNLGAIPLYYYPPGSVKLLLSYVTSHSRLCDLDAPGTIIPWLLTKSHPVYAHIVSSNTLDVGSPADLSTAQQFKVK